MAVIHAPLLGKTDGQDHGSQDISGVCGTVSGISGVVQKSAKQEGIPEKPGSGGFIIAAAWSLFSY